MNIFRLVRFIALTGSWLCFFIYLKDQTQNYYLYGVPVFLAIAFLVGPVQKRMTQRVEEVG